MSKSKSSRISRVSLGGRQKANLNHYQKRMDKFAAKKGTDKEYHWTKNPYDPNTQPEEYMHEQMDRAEKNKSKKLPLAYITSIMAKLDNELADEAKRVKESNMKKRK